MLRLAACSDPGFLTSEDYEKFMWEKLLVQNAAYTKERRAALPA